MHLGIWVLLLIRWLLAIQQRIRAGLGNLSLTPGDQSKYVEGSHKGGRNGFSLYHQLTWPLPQ